jgi:hypothetical protein
MATRLKHLIRTMFKADGALVTLLPLIFSCALNILNYSLIRKFQAFSFYRLLTIIFPSSLAHLNTGNFDFSERFVYSIFVIFSSSMYPSLFL